MSNLFLTKWDESTHPKDPQLKWDSLHNLYAEASTLFIPLTTPSKENKSNCKWMTRKALKAIDRKKKKWDIFKDNKNDLTEAIYNEARNAGWFASIWTKPWF